MKKDSVALLAEIREIAAEVGTVQLMEVCGTHTVSLFRTGVKSLLPESVKLISGPGCPVCVTSQGYIDTALEIAMNSDAIIATYGDMMRVPGRLGCLAGNRASGAEVQVCYSARDALALAVKNPDKKVVWIGVGFETTAPTTAAMLLEAKRKGIENVFALVSHKLVIPAMQTVLSAGEVVVDGFLCPGHVSVIIGEDAYQPILEFGKPCVIAGFEAQNMLEGILALLKQIKEKRAEVENVYGVAVSKKGNQVAWKFVEEVFDVADDDWRAMGTLPQSGLKLKEEYKKFDALAEFGLEMGEDYDPPGCLCGQVIQGKAKPIDCKLFGAVCTVYKPVGPCMVSSEGTCAAWYKYGINMEESRSRVEEA
jgi:hydrogenase expression/formation protein HypD